MTSYKMIVKLIGYMWHLAAFIGLAVVFAVSGHALVMVIPGLLMALGLTALTQQTPPAWSWLWLLLGLAVLRGLLRYGEHYFGHYVAFRVLADFRAAVYAKLRRLAPNKLTEQNSGSLLKMMGEDIEALEVFFAHTLAPVLTGIVLTLGLMVYWSGIHRGVMGVALLTYATLTLWLPHRFSRRLAPLLAQQGQARLAYSQHFVDSLKGMRDLVQFDRVDAAFQDLNDQSVRVNHLESQVAQANHRQTSATFLVVGLAIVAVALLLLEAYQSGTLTLTQAAVGLVVFTSSFPAYLELSRLPLGFKRAILAGERVFGLLEEPERVVPASAEPLAELEDVVMDEVRFAYEGRSGWVLDNLSATFTKGRIIGLMGASGSGKSTLMKLLMNWYLPTEGQVRLNELATAALEPTSVQARIAYIPQLPQLFHQTLRDNLRLANPDLSDERILEVAAQCQIKEAILRLPEGLDTVFNPQAPQFSSGEMQRLELTRALLKEADAYIFDEPTSYLDSLNEAAILRIIQAHCQGYVFLISHRMSTVACADDLYQVADGQLLRLK